MKQIRLIRSRIEPCRRQLFDLLPPLFLPMISKESRHEINQPFQPLYAEALAPRPSHAPQTAYSRKRGYY